MKCVIVTGGSRGLGLALVEGLLQDGYRVATCSRSTSGDIERLNQENRYAGRFSWQACSVEDADQVERFVEESLGWFGEDGLYGLINNAGIAASGVLATFPNIESQRILEVNLHGSLQMARQVLRYLLRQAPGGRIINVSSVIASRGYTGLAAYSASKAGMEAMSRSLARELGRRNITVNSVAPGYMSTEMSSTLSQGQLKQIVNRTPLGRLCTSDDVLAVVRFLLSDAAQFITGQTIVVDGGLTS
jgi:3-oxoacyl-[acyl-carrier protein] reductase